MSAAFEAGFVVTKEGNDGAIEEMIISEGTQQPEGSKLIVNKKLFHIISRSLFKCVEAELERLEDQKRRILEKATSQIAGANGLHHYLASGRPYWATWCRTQ